MCQKRGNKNNGNATKPIHIKIIDQTGVISYFRGGFTAKPENEAYTMSAVNLIQYSSNKIQFQQTEQKFNSDIKD